MESHFNEYIPPMQHENADQILDWAFPWLSKAANCGYPINFLSRNDFEGLENGLPQIPASPPEIAEILQMLMSAGYIELYFSNRLTFARKYQPTRAEIEWDLWHPQSRPLRYPNSWFMTLTEVGLKQVSRRVSSSGFTWTATADFFVWVESEIIPRITSTWCVRQMPAITNDMQARRSYDEQCGHDAWKSEMVQCQRVQYLLPWLIGSAGRWSPVSECTSSIKNPKVDDSSAIDKVARDLLLLVENNYLLMFRTTPIGILQHTYLPSIAEIAAELLFGESLSQRRYGVLMVNLTDAAVRHLFGLKFDGGSLWPVD